MSYPSLEPAALQPDRALLGTPFALPTDCPQALLLCATYDDGVDADAIFAQERIALPAAIARSVPRRRAEFLAGRLLARAALLQLGVPRPDASKIGQSPSRAPLWPRGTTGALSHDQGFAACFVTRANRLLLGVDVAHLGTNADERAAVWDHALTAADRLLLQTGAELAQPHMALLVFSAKETLFKAVYPVVGTLFGFEAAEVARPITAGHLVLRMTVAVGPTLSQGLEFRIAYLMSGHRILTWLACPAP